MVGFTQMRELERKARALSAESDVYRELLQVQVQQVRQEVRALQQRWQSHPLGRLLSLWLKRGRPSSGGWEQWLRKLPQGGWLGLAQRIWKGWRLYQRVQPWWKAFWTQAAQQKAPQGASAAEAQTPRGQTD